MFLLNVLPLILDPPLQRMEITRGTSWFHEEHEFQENRRRAEETGDYSRSLPYDQWRNFKT